MSTSATLVLPTSDGGSVKLEVSGAGAQYTPPASGPVAPAQAPPNAIWTPHLELATSLWKSVHDEGTQGTSSGTGPTPNTEIWAPGPAAKFSMNYTDGGGQRWWATVADDLNVNHFMYDTWVWIDRPDLLNCLELDVNHVDGNGNTIILGIQWAPKVGCWMWTTMPNHQAHWNNSNISARTTDFAPKTWHHVQLRSHHDINGVAYYDDVTIDGVTRPFLNCQGASWAALGWGPKGHININMQLDGVGASGALVVQHSNLSIARWQA